MSIKSSEVSMPACIFSPPVIKEELGIKCPLVHLQVYATTLISLEYYCIYIITIKAHAIAYSRYCNETVTMIYSNRTITCVYYEPQ